MIAILALYLGVLLAISIHEYRSFNLSWDFAQANQAWYLVAHGVGNPYDTLHHHYWWQDHGELVIWLLAPLYWLDPNDGLTLLVAQDVAIVVGVAAAADWVRLACRRRLLGPRLTAVCVGVPLLLCVTNAGIYATVFYDYHGQVPEIAFLLLAGRDVYAGRRRRALVWGALTLLSMDLGALELAALGVGLAVSAARLRRSGLVMAGAGLGWYTALALVGGTKGTTLTYYDQVAGGPVGAGVGAYATLLSGAAAHPSRVAHLIHAYRYAIYDNLIPAGLVGILSPTTVVAILAVLVPGVLSSYGGFIAIGFQNCPAALLGALGTGLALAYLATPSHSAASPTGPKPASQGGASRRPSWLIASVAAATVASALACDATIASHGGEIRSHVDAAAAAQLAAVRRLTPAGAEVAIPFGVVGRFSGRPWAYLIHDLPVTIPLQTGETEVIFAPRAGNEWIPSTLIRQAERALVAHDGARVLYAGSEVQAYALAWRPERRRLTLP